MFLPLDSIAAVLYLGLACESARPPLPEAGVAVLAFLGAWVALFLLAATFARLALRVLRQPETGTLTRHRMAAGYGLMSRIATVIVFAFFLEFTQWPFVISRAFDLPAVYALLNLLGILPYMLFCLAAWLPFYSVHRRTHPGEWTRGSYLLHRVRYSFFLFGLWLPLLALLELLDAESLPWIAALPFWAKQCLLYALLLLGGWTFPLFLRFFWGCRPVPAGPLRERIETLQKKAGVRFSGIYLWSLGGEAVLNAAAVGVLPPFQYLFLSRGLLEKLPPDEVEAVVCHEMGHLRYRHILFFLVVSILFMTLANLLAIPLADSLAAGSTALRLLFLFGGILLYVRLLFGFLSRRTERQADLFALEVTGDAAPLCRALERIGFLSGNIRLAASWHHLSIAQRVSFLRAAERNPALRQRHHQHVRNLMIAAYAGAAFVILHAILTPRQAALPPAEAEVDAAVSPAIHWRRVTRLLPDSPRGPMELSRLLLHAGRAAAIPEAVLAAREATRRARTLPERREADSLLREAVRALENRSSPPPDAAGES